ncbi:MAG: ATP synthase epsilon chain [Candidatus Gottesmanbacteria bacterium GW2011_GWC2_39_8]|uniref:ATP synthase epsilon chain n=1 Tax=Candidatus Gottesmanbacteria bacterium GW2011_GWC2_39_8 TaxID=1618450 RepID=A0A0G0T821_9BACT|nr:MAG: ATP synthase epsilon chain [Candidatus Gottesmanbacteria bacterium GW2011_GWC2_39_8]
MSQFLLEIITPERIAYSEQVDAVNVPTVSGHIGVLPHHVPLFSELTEGELKIVSGKEEYYMAIGGGFIEVAPDKVTVLVSRALHADEINEKEILAARNAAEDALKTKPSGAALAEAEALLRRSVIAMKVLRRKHRMPPRL